MALKVMLQNLESNQSRKQLARSLTRPCGDAEFAHDSFKEVSGEKSVKKNLFHYCKRLWSK